MSRALLKVDGDAAKVATELEAGDPPIYVMTDRLADNELVLELVPLDAVELEIILLRLTTILTA